MKQASDISIHDIRGNIVECVSISTVVPVAGEIGFTVSHRLEQGMTMVLDDEGDAMT